MLKYQDYEDEFNQLGIFQTDACIVLDYLQAIAEIGIKFNNEKKDRENEELCNMDKSVN
ncbi:hypothetical protein [Mediterranea massiliensis]|uniref:hypothetical protein n=1 Tax=Mediterranea massiliensis TaxID=1841865 RepID=UPI00139033D1|nr:hypothetical protein [Mediterranea massiliensis]